MKTFEEYLREYHEKQADGVLDDDTPEAFEEWLSELEGDDWIYLGTRYGSYCAKEIRNIFTKEE